MLSEQQQRIMGYFIEEAKDHLNTLEQGLLNLQATIADSEMVSEVFRAAHSVKGGAAMLGLSSIQHIAHRLEDYFKVLKECPVKVDQRLETLFLRIFDSLQELIDQLQGPFGLTEDRAQEVMAEVEPVFGELGQHLNLLVSQSGSSLPEDVELAPAVVPVAPLRQPTIAREESALQLIFQSDVPAQLREMLQLFKQSDTAESRQRLQAACRTLSQPGEQLDLPHWCSLLDKVERAIASPSNTYRTLAPIVIKDIKHAQEQVLQGRSTEITASSGLLDLLPVAEEDTNIVDTSFADLLATIDAADPREEAMLSDLFSIADQPGLDSTEDDWFMSELADSPAVSLSKVSLDLDFGQAFVEEPDEQVGESDRSEDAADLELTLFGETVSAADLDLVAQINLPATVEDHTGPEVGIAELNSLADLFEGEVPDLGFTWEEEQVLDPSTNGFYGATEEPNDFDDLLFEQDASEDLVLDDFEEDLSGLLTNLEQSVALSDFNSLNLNLSAEPKQEASTEIYSLNLEPPLAQTQSQDEDQDEDFADILFAATPDQPIVTEEGLFGTSAANLKNSSGFENLDDLLSGLEVESLTPQVRNSQASTVEMSDLDALFGSAAMEPEPLFEDSSAADELSAAAAPQSSNDAPFDLAFDSEVVDLEAATDFDSSTHFPSLSKSDLEEDFPWDSSDLGTDLWEEPATIAMPQASDVSAEEREENREPFTLAPDPANYQSDFQSDLLPDLDAGDEPDFADRSAADVEDLGFDLDALFLGNTVAEDRDDWSANALEVSADEPIDSTSDRSDSLEENLLDLATPEDAESDQPIAAEPAVLPLNSFDLEGLGAELDTTGLDSIFGEDDASASPFDFDFEGSEFEEAQLDNTEQLELDSSEAAIGAIAESSAPRLDEATLNDSAPFEMFDQPDEPLDSFFLTENAEFSSLDSAPLDSAESADGLTREEAIDWAAGEATLVEVDRTSALDNEFNDEFDDEFADLEAMLGDDAEDITVSSLEENEFADLEAMLGDNASENMVSSLAASLEEDEFGDLEDLLEDVKQKLGGTSSGARQSAINRRPNPRRNMLNEQTMRVSVKHLDNLNNLVGEMVVNRNSLEQAQERLRQFLDNLLYQVQQLSDVGQRMRDLYERSLLESSLLSNRRSYHLSPQSGSFSTLQPNHSTGASFDALEMDRFTGFHTLSQEMIELIVRVRESASDIDFVVEESDQVTRNFRQITTQLQEGLTRSRMVPFAQTADRLPRGVRDNSLKYGKQSELLIEGRDTLIDKMIVEQLYDPMTHLVNNAVAHGIETPAERVAADKAPTGKITIRAFHQGNQTVISVSDDGAGINPEQVKAKAISRGLITAAEARDMSRLDVYDLLFHHGFSTADQVDDLRGRGVGLDVVRNNLNEIRGVISIDSVIGKGTTFTIRLPLTLSISKALCCISNRARIAFPMDGVEDMLDVPKERIQTDSEGQACIYWRDAFLPFQPLATLLGYNRILGRGSVYGGNQEEDIISIVVLRSAGNYLALQVDQVLGEQEIVIKQLEGPIPKPVGVAGATVLGDGRIMPIADVLELIDLSQGRIRREAGSSLWDKGDEMLPLDPAELKTEPTVLIVDDSITVRELLSMTFNKVGYRVEQARDGQEAWEKLRAGLPCDLVFCDIEMPRMDGLELLSRIQKDPNLAHLPIAMLTSRGADRHRQMAVQLGAKGYFTKPYLEEGLLDAAQRMLKGEVLVTPG